MPADEAPIRALVPEATEVVYSLQILRGIAALLVTFYHFSPYLRTTIPGRNLGFTLFSEGYVGVDIFFLISGFIIVHSTERSGHAAPLAFGIRRFFRVVPLAQIATLLYALILPVRPSTPALLRSLLFLPQADFDPPKFGYPVIPQEWTLAYELIFYLMFAAVLVFTHRRRVAVTAVLMLFSIVSCQWMLGGPLSPFPNGVPLPSEPVHPLWSAVLGQWGNPIMAEFIAGMLLAAAYRRWEAALRRDRWARAERLVGGLLVAAFVGTYCTAAHPGNGLLNKGWGALCLVAGSLLLELSLPRPGSAPGRRPIFAAFLWLGAISYSLYLVHMGIAERCLRFVAFHALGLTVGGLVGFGALVPTALLLAWILHSAVEVACIRAGKKLAEMTD